MMGKSDDNIHIGLRIESFDGKEVVYTDIITRESMFALPRPAVYNAIRDSVLGVTDMALVQIANEVLRPHTPFQAPPKRQTYFAATMNWLRCGMYRLLKPTR